MELIPPNAIFGKTIAEREASGKLTGRCLILVICQRKTSSSSRIKGLSLLRCAIQLDFAILLFCLSYCWVGICSWRAVSISYWVFGFLGDVDVLIVEAVSWSRNQCILICRRCVGFLFCLDPENNDVCKKIRYKIRKCIIRETSAYINIFENRGRKNNITRGRQFGCFNIKFTTIQSSRSVIKLSNSLICNSPLSSNFFLDLIVIFAFSKNIIIIMARDLK